MLPFLLECSIGTAGKPVATMSRDVELLAIAIENEPGIHVLRQVTTVIPGPRSLQINSPLHQVPATAGRIVTERDSLAAPLRLPSSA